MKPHLLAPLAPDIVLHDWNNWTSERAPTPDGTYEIRVPPGAWIADEAPSPAMSPAGESASVADIPSLPLEPRPAESSWARPAVYWGVALVALGLLWFLRSRASKSKR